MLLVYQSIKFLLNIPKKPANIVGKTTMSIINGKEYLVKHYKNRYVKYNQSIIVFSGFSVKGYQDERLKALAKALASVGFNTLIIRIEDIEELKISLTTSREIQQCIKHFATNNRFSKNGKVGIVAPSFSAGLVLKACSSDGIDQYVNGICCIGTYANIESSVNYVMKNENTDNYGRNILLYNFILGNQLSTNTDIVLLLKAAIEDNGHKRIKPILPEIIESTDQNTKELWNKINSNSEFRMQLFNELVKKIPNGKKN